MDWAGPDVLLKRPLNLSFRRASALRNLLFLAASRDFRDWRLSAFSGRLEEKSDPMAKPRNRTDKHFQLDAVKLKRAQKALRAKTAGQRK